MQFSKIGLQTDSKNLAKHPPKWELLCTSGSTAETKFKKSVFWDTCSTCVEHSFLGPSVHGAGFFAHWHCFGLISFVILPAFEFERLTITYYTVNIESWPGSSSICCFCSIFVLCLLIFSRGGSISYRCGKIWRKCSLIFCEEFNIILTPAPR